MKMDLDENFINLKQLFIHLEQFFIARGSSQNTYEMLLDLPDMDQNFHRLEMVKEIKTFLRNSLKVELEDAIESYLTEAEEESHLKNRNSLEYLSNKFNSNKNFHKAKLELEQLFNKMVINLSGEKDTFINEMRGIDQISNYAVKNTPSVASIDVSLNSSLNQSGFLFLNPSEYTNIAECLDKRHLRDNIMKSIDLLLIVTPGEPVSQNLWPSMKKNLKELLQIEDDELFLKALKFHSRLLSSQIFTAVKEGILNLIEAISEFWLNRKLYKRLNKYNGTPIDEKVLRMIYLLLQFLKEFPFVWIRYSTSYVSEISNSFFNLFDIGRSDDQFVSFIEILSLLDPKAEWFYSWTHSQVGRKITFNIINANSSLVSNSLSICSKHLNSLATVASKGDGDLPLNYSEILKFNHCINISFHLIRFTEGRNLYPVYDKTKKDHVTLKKCLHFFLNGIKLSKICWTSKIVLTLFCKFCNANEETCKLLCDFGIVDSLIEMVETSQSTLSPSVSLQPCYLKLILKVLISVNSIPVGHEYILIGKSVKPTAKVLLTSNNQTPAQKIFNFVELLMNNEQICQLKKIMKTVYTLCCVILHSPLGRHFFLTHNVIRNIIHYAKYEFESNDTYVVNKRVMCGKEIKIYFEEEAENVIRNLIQSYSGLIILKKNNILIHTLDLALLHFLNSQIILISVLTKIVCLEQGCFALRNTNILMGSWNKLKLEVTEEPLIKQPMQPEEITNLHEETLLPLLSICSTFEGLKLLFSGDGLLKEVKKCLMNIDEHESDLFYTLVLKLLAFCAPNLNSVIYLQSILNMKELLLCHQEEMSVDGIEIIDENYLLRKYILSLAHCPGKISNHQDFISLTLETDCIINNSTTTGEKENKKADKESCFKKRSELAHFLNNTRKSPHDNVWLGQCRKAYRSDLLSQQEETKVPPFLEMLELVLELLASLPDEIMPATSPVSDHVVDDIPSPISTSFSNNVFCYSAASESGSVEDVSPSEESVSHFEGSNMNSKCTPSSVGIEMMIRYGSDNNLITNNEAQRSNLLKLWIAVDAFLLKKYCRRSDWFSAVLYYLTSGNFDKSFQLLRKLRSLKIGAVIWPRFMDSLCTTHDLAPREFLLSSLIHSTQLVLFRDNPTAFLAIESISGGIVWNLVNEWYNQSFVGSLSWPQNLYVILTCVLFGGDYLVYALVSILIHIHQNLVELSNESEFKKINYIQSTAGQGWKIEDNFGYMDSLCKRFRRIVNEILLTPLSKIKT